MTLTAARERAVEAELRDAVHGVDAPDVVFAHSARGRRTLVTGGTAPPPGTAAAPGRAREELRYELGSASKTFTGLLLAELARRGEVRLSDPVSAYLPVAPAARGHRDEVTLLHLITHTSGLPRLPWDFYPRALPHWYTGPYARYPVESLVDAFARSRVNRPPGTRWHYSNFGVALLGPALENASATRFARLLTHRVLAPLGLDSTGLVPLGPGVDAPGHGVDGSAVVPPFETGGFFATGAVRITPGEVLTYLEAHLRPEGTPLREALHTVGEPLLRRGAGHRHIHTLTWFSHATDDGPVYFHGGATMGQEVFLGFRPATATAVAAFATRRYRRGTTLSHAAYRLLTATAGHGGAPVRSAA